MLASPCSLSRGSASGFFEWEEAAAKGSSAAFGDTMDPGRVCGKTQEERTLEENESLAGLRICGGGAWPGRGREAASRRRLAQACARRCARSVLEGSLSTPSFQVRSFGSRDRTSRRVRLAAAPCTVSRHALEDASCRRGSGHAHGAFLFTEGFDRTLRERRSVLRTRCAAAA